MVIMSSAFLSALIVEQNVKEIKLDPITVVYKQKYIYDANYYCEF